MNTNHEVSPRAQTSPPGKLCAVCGEIILWRRRLAANWEEVRCCSASCRRSLVAESRTRRHERRDVSSCFAAKPEASAA